MKNQSVNLISGQQDAIGRALREEGWWSGRIVPATLAGALLEDAEKLYQQQQFGQAAVGVQHSKIINHSVRGDQTFWLTTDNAVQAEFLDTMQLLKNVFESHFPIPLHNFDGHYSHYPQGTFYQKHMDNARQSNNRVFSVVNYLNSDWQAGDGGELVLFHPETGTELIRIPPVFGHSVIFFSSDFPHEVAETHKPRYSLTGWFHQRRNT